MIADIVRRGIAEDVFRDVDARRIAEHVLATVAGARYGDATTDREGALAVARVSLSAYLNAELRTR